MAAFAKWHEDKCGWLPTETNIIGAFLDHRVEFCAEIASEKHKVYARDKYPFGEWEPLDSALFHTNNYPLLCTPNSIKFRGANTIIHGVMVVLNASASDDDTGSAEKRVTAVETKKKKGGRRAELAPALERVFSGRLSEPDALAIICRMTQEARRKFVGAELGFAEDELPSRTYVNDIWKKWWSEHGLSE